MTLSESALETELQIKNPGQQRFSFTTLLHTYFQTEVSAIGCFFFRKFSVCHNTLIIQDINSVSVQGLKGLTFDDSLTKMTQKEEREAVIISGEVDRIYKNVPDSIQVSLGNGTTISLSKKGFRDAVVWNPWIDKAKAMADFGDEEVVWRSHFFPCRISGHDI